jgi:hypothetical protein
MGLERLEAAIPNLLVAQAGPLLFAFSGAGTIASRFSLVKGNLRSFLAIALWFPDGGCALGEWI